MLAFALSGVYAIADGFFVGNALGEKFSNVLERKLDFLIVRWYANNDNDY